MRSSEAKLFQDAAEDVARHVGYFLKSFSADGQVALRRVRSHVQFADWSVSHAETKALLTEKSVHLVTITVTESGYYTDPNGDLNISDPTIKSEIEGELASSVYGYLRAALQNRSDRTGAPLTIACCDNIRQKGKMLRRNLGAYMVACGD